MRDKEDRRLVGIRRPQALVVERGNHGLACASCRDKQVAVSIVHLPLGGEVIQHLCLMWVRTHVEMADRQVCRGGAAAVLREECIEEFGVSVWVVRRKRSVVPVGFEGRLKLVDQGRSREVRETDVPFQSVDERRPAHVRAAHIRGGVPTGPMEHPRLRVEMGGLRVVVHPHFGVQRAHEVVQRLPVRGTDICGGQNPDGHAALSRLAQS